MTEIIENVEGAVPFIVLIVILFLLLKMAIKIFPEYERGVLFRLGRLVTVKGPGLVFIIPFIDKIERISLRIVVDNVPPQEVITRDNVTCKVNAVLYYRVTAPDKAVVNVEKFYDATSQFAQTTMRSVVGQADLDELLSEREKINKKIQEIVDEATDPWGIKATAVELRDVIIPETMQRAIARQAEAERNRRAVVIQAEGEKQAAVKISEAAEILSHQEGSLTLRTLRTISDMSNSESTTILFPVPMEMRRLLPNLDKIMEESMDYREKNKADQDIEQKKEKIKKDIEEQKIEDIEEMEKAKKMVEKQKKEPGENENKAGPKKGPKENADDEKNN
ncbi:slipin family protein [Isachenkonia alkalipeptolytica]|uniref:Slipin family protein n=1 Tax=Isachenkonia alkalipeptolytica TaxID=2565777 RepID=A0AA43XLB2_9CLOT|nr:slipin family protein [Isachenkonia alkalipeptolytica]NBG88501.1 slipin family protein [Isachenkonia alkalipeptolytica]